MINEYFACLTDCYYGYYNGSISFRAKGVLPQSEINFVLSKNEFEKFIIDNEIRDISVLDRAIVKVTIDEKSKCTLDSVYGYMEN